MMANNGPRNAYDINEKNIEALALHSVHGVSKLGGS